MLANCAAWPTRTLYLARASEETPEHAHDLNIVILKGRRPTFFSLVSQTVSKAMASGRETRQKGVEALEQEITCLVCHDHFQEPKILPCLHYYCKKCIQALVKRAGGPNQPFPCPECRTPTLLPQGDPDQLQTAFFVNRMKEVHAKLEKVQGKVEAKCEMCSSGEATAFCRQCAEFICEKCKDSHERMKLFAGHSVSTLEELKEGGVKEIIVAKSAPPPMCYIHEEQAKIYCYNCNTLICQVCIIDGDHENHEYVFVKKAASKTRKELMERLVPLNEGQKGIQDAIMIIEGVKSEVIAMDESMTASIKQSFQELRDILNRREKELLAETTATVEKKMNNLNMQQKKLEMSLGTIQSLAEFVERNIEKATDEELMTIHMQMMTRINEETEKQQLSTAELAPVEKANKVVVIECIEELKKQCQENASIVTLPMNIVIDVAEPQVGQRSQLVAQLTLQDGQPVKKMQNIKVTLKSKVDGSCLQAEVVWKQQNAYQIEFTPTVRGRHQLEVMCNDKPVLREPIQVFVKIPPAMLGSPVKRIDVRKSLNFIAFNSSEEMLVTAGREVIIFNKGGKKLHSITDRNLGSSTGIAVDGSNIYVADYNSNTLLKFDETGRLLKSIGQKGSGKGSFNNPTGLTVVNNEVIVCDSGNCRLQVFTSDLVFVRHFGTIGLGNSQFLDPWDVTHDEVGNVYVTNYRNDRVHIFNAQGRLLRSLVAPGHITKPVGITFCRGVVYISQWKNNGKLYMYLKNGEEAGSIPCKSSYNGLRGIAIDQDGFIYICDNDKQQVIVL